MARYLVAILCLFTLNEARAAESINAESPQGSPFRVGAGKADITGPAGDVGMMGYADAGQKTAGIHSRLWSRAFVIEDSSSRRLVFVSADLGFISRAVKLEVVSRLQVLYGRLYSHENLMLTATHTHAGPGGFSHYTLFNITIGGFNERNFEAIVSGITRSIQQAHESLRPSKLYLNEGRLEGITVNRSLGPHLANPETTRDEDSVNPLMTVLRIVDASGHDRGMLNWFPIHGTSLSKQNRLISSDNKGYAASRFEREIPGTIAAFGNSEEGDVSPAIFDTEWNRRHDDLESVRVSGEAQFRKALELHHGADRSLDGSVEFRHSWVRMPGLTVTNEFTGIGQRRLCKAALGYSFAAGAEDGRSGVPGFREGLRQGEINPISNPLMILYGLASLVLAPPDAKDDSCHFPKPVLIAPGRQDPVWTPEVLPFQLFRIGSLAVIGVPGEMTTAAGKELRRLVTDRLAPAGVERAVIAGLANTYSDYITTRPEYEQQHYEGASTLYGPHTFDAYRQIFSGLTEAMREGAAVASDPAPAPPIHVARGTPPELAFDDKRLWEKWGKPLEETLESYARGDTARALFRSGHASNSLMTERSFAGVERLSNSGQWFPVAGDDDPEVLYHWKLPLIPDCLACSDAEISWTIPHEAEPGTYRLVHRGARKSFSGKLKSVFGASRSFEVR